MHVKVELLTDGLDVLETFLVVRTGPTNPDLHLVLIEDWRDLPQGADDTLEGGSDVGEVGNTTTDEQHLAVRVGRGPQHQVKHCAGVVVGLCLGRSTRVFTIVGEFVDKASGGNSICIDDRRTTTGHEGPDTAVAVEDGEFERGTGLGVHVRNELLFLAHLPTKGSGELHGRTSVDGDLVSLRSSGQTQVGGATSNGPFGATLELGRLVELGGQVEEVNLGRGTICVGDDDQRVDLEVCELAVDVDGVKTGDEVHQYIVDSLRDLVQESLGNLLVGGIVLEVDGNEQFLGLGVDITNVDTTFVSEEDPIALIRQLFVSGILEGITYLTDGVDVDVVFGILGVRDKRLDEELTEDTRDSLDLNVLARTSLNPFFGLRPGLVEAEQSTLASPLDQLVWFGNELGTGSE